MNLADRLFAHLLSPQVIGVSWPFRIWSKTATVLALLAMTAPYRRSTYAAIADAVDRCIGGAIPQADPAGLHRAMGKLAVGGSLDGLMAGIQDRLEDRLRSMRWLPKAVDGRPMVAVDATDLVLGTSPVLVKAFGGPSPSPGRQAVAHAKLLVAWDVHRRAVLGWHLAPYGCDERQELLSVLPHMPDQAILVLDRGYPSRDVVKRLHDRGLHVIVRVPGGRAAWTEYRETMRQGSGVRERTALVNGVPCRVVIRPRHRGRPGRNAPDHRIILRTNLPATPWPAAAVIAAYRRRWAIESFFREFKVTITTVERWHSRRESRIILEIQATLIWFLLAALLELQRLRDPEARRRYLLGFEPERTRLLRATQRVIEDLVTTGTCDLEQILQPLRKRLVKPRSDRSFKRVRQTPHGRTRG